VGRHQTFTLDSQNSDAKWRLPLEWLKLELNPFVKQGLITFNKAFHGI